MTTSVPEKQQQEKRSGVMLPSGHWIASAFLHNEANFGKLITHEDNFHVHKTLGILSVLSFVYRYAVVYNQTGTLGFAGATRFDWITMWVHMLLAVSSIIFRVPPKRIASKPMVIYSEYRLHAIVFTVRCFAVFAISAFFPSGAPAYAAPLALLACHLVADEITRRHGTPGNTAVRANAGDQPFWKKVALVYGFYQHLSIGAQLLPSEQQGDLAYNSIIAIASSAFFMTLYRKKIIRGRTHMVAYTLCLFLSAFHIVRVIGLAQTAAIAVAFAARVNLPREYSSKYAIWTVYVMLSLYNMQRLGPLPEALQPLASNISGHLPAMPALPAFPAMPSMPTMPAFSS